MSKIDIKTRDGLCPSHVYRPAGPGPWPAVLGWVFPDFPVYDAAASERHWQTMLPLLDAELRG